MKKDPCANPGSDSNFRAHPWTSPTDLEIGSRTEPFARRTRNGDYSSTADGDSPPPPPPDRQSNKPDNLMPKAQSYQYQPRLTILCARSPRRHRLYRSRRQRLDAQTVAALDTVYQEAVKANDVAVMDRILADDFVLVTDRGASLTKADLIKEAREKRTIYEHQEEEEGTQKVRIWRDTAVVTALLRIKGTRDQNPFDYKVWFSETYVRTPTGWRYVFGQASIPLPKPDAK